MMDSSSGGRIMRFSGSSFTDSVTLRKVGSVIACRPLAWTHSSRFTHASLMLAPNFRRVRMSVDDALSSMDQCSAWARSALKLLSPDM